MFYIIPPKKTYYRKTAMMNFFITKFSHISIIIIFLIFLEINKFLEVKLHDPNSKDICNIL